jgi:phage terminase small subunit
LTIPTSIRGQREQRGEQRAQTPSVTPRKPDWLPGTADAIWKSVIRDLKAASVPMGQRIDCHAIGMYALTILEAHKATEQGDTKLAARLGRDALQWAGQIGATPASRARLGIKPPKPEDPDDPWARL